MMDWASQRAKERSATFWKAFTTGKSRSLGGIPHVCREREREGGEQKEAI